MSQSLYPSSILLVDDDQADNFIHSMSLQHLDWVERIHHCLYADSALQFLAVNDVNVIFLDLHLPRMNGFEFLEAYRALNLSKRSPIILLTSSLAPLDLERANQYQELFAYCSKPLTKEKAEVVLKSVCTAQERRPRSIEDGKWREPETSITNVLTRV